MSRDFSARMCCGFSAEDVASLLPGVSEYAASHDNFDGLFPDGTSYSVWENDFHNLAEPGDGLYGFRAGDTFVKYPLTVTISGSLKLLESWDSVPEALLDLRWKVRGKGTFQLGDVPCLAWDGKRSWFNPDPEYPMASLLERSTLHTADDVWKPADIELMVGATIWVEGL